ncbi:MAG: NADH:ubiquinone reductase (Na(+)-transporting) subunit B [Elusimicrobia bacterium]|nr:MAG: NADH:ubiquinone reductase (Na(+)-transporting) subunit B [Elusimicrobiota bacterium]
MNPVKLLEDKIEEARPLFEKGGKLEKLYPLFEAKETFLLSPATVTTGGTHVRDALDMKRLMIMVVAAILPTFFAGSYNVGLQALLAQGLSTDFISCMATGLMVTVPIVITSYAVGGFWEVTFALVRRHEINEGFLVTGLLFPLTLPPSIPLWMVAVGVSFGVVLGKEVFGGTGMNILNPALTARAFVFFAYPASISGDRVWVAGKALIFDKIFPFFTYSNESFVDGFSGATPLLVSASQKNGDVAAALGNAGFTLKQAFLGSIPGSIGETSTMACLIGAYILIVTGVGSWRIMVSCVAGALAMAALMNGVAGPESAGIMHLPGMWHLMLGGFMFGTVFMATDPVSAARTERGKIIYGLLIGALAVLIRSVNPAYPEGVMLAILFLNILAPLIDYTVMQGHFARRKAWRGAKNV